MAHPEIYEEKFAENYKDIRELTEDVFKLLKGAGKVMNKNLLIEIDTKSMEVIVYEEETDSEDQHP